jgi:hypothetical protein
MRGWSDELRKARQASAEGSILSADILCTKCTERLRDALAKFVEVRAS